MDVMLTIGDFSRMTHLSVKALRHYHDIGLLEPAAVDRSSGYRMYRPDQVPTAQVIRRFRDLGMPLDEVKAVMEAADVEARNAAIVAHLERMEDQLAQTQATVGSLRALITATAEVAAVDFRYVPPLTALAVRDPVAVPDFPEWWVDAFARLEGAAAAAGLHQAGPRGSLYHGDFFEQDIGEVVAFLPISGGRPGPSAPRDMEVMAIPGAELAVALHRGPLDDIDRTYGTLGTFVAERAVGVDGPIREVYLVTFSDTPDQDRHETEVGWPVFRTAATPSVD